MLRNVQIITPVKTKPFQRGDRLYVCRRQILTYKDGQGTERIKMFIMAVDPKHRYSNEAERAN